MTRRRAPRSGAEPNDSRLGWIDRNEKTLCAALQPMLTFGNKVHLAKMCAEGLEMIL